ncbi:MAG: polysaccharide biosynthesis/export family protein [Chitinispirillaceae bacterium]|jgi:polysaccharide export outer membrane protein
MMMIFTRHKAYNRGKSIPVICAMVATMVFLLSANAAAGGDEYVLKPGDVISVDVVEHPEFSGHHKIRPDGRINYPVIGELDVSGLTCPQLVTTMEGKLSPYINNPVVSVSIEAYFANKIFIIGDVNRPGEFEIYEPIDLIKAIAMCGGTKNAAARTAKIIRADGTIVTVNLQDLWNGKLSKQETNKYLLYPGDTIFIPETFLINWGLIATILGATSLVLQIILYSIYINEH